MYLLFRNGSYGYVEHFGMGVRNRIIGSMRSHNGTEPDLIEEEHRFIVRLWKEPGKEH
jgi:ATP-dependent DNA helicase RecG